LLAAFRTMALNCPLWPIAGVADGRNHCDAYLSAGWFDDGPIRMSALGAPSAQKAATRIVAPAGNLCRIECVIAFSGLTLTEGLVSHSQETLQNLYGVLCLRNVLAAVGGSLNCAQRRRSP
jgi:hypothetical protein